MTRYNNFTVENLAADEMFRNWILNPTPELSEIWKSWLTENPEKQQVVNQATELVIAVHAAYYLEISEELVDMQIGEIVYLAESKNKPNLSLGGTFWRIAACLLLTAGLGWIFHLSELPPIKSNSKSSLTGTEKMMVRTNHTDHEMTILLSDNSVATLMKGSTLIYPAKFTHNERKVELSGEAFFDITKNPGKPFLVFANETVTRVLGTSFRVRAFEEDNTVMVLVKTGKVSVFQMKEYDRHAEQSHQGVILNPNQQVVFTRDHKLLKKGTVANPGMLSESSAPTELIFDEKPVSEVLHALEGIYGIVIVFDKESLKNCVISAQFDEESLKQRMNAICQAIGASYEMIDGQIVINSKGCS